MSIASGVHRLEDIVSRLKEREGALADVSHFELRIIRGCLEEVLDDMVSGYGVTYVPTHSE